MSEQFLGARAFFSFSQEENHIFIRNWPFKVGDISEGLQLNMQVWDLDEENSELQI